MNARTCLPAVVTPHVRTLSDTTRASVTNYSQEIQTARSAKVEPNESKMSHDLSVFYI